MSQNLSRKCVAEFIGTFTLIFIGVGAIHKASNPAAGVGLLGVALAIGLTIALDILFGGPIAGAAMNPARTLGPAVAANIWKDHAVYWIGPMAGGALAGLIYGRFLIKESK